MRLILTVFELRTAPPLAWFKMEFAPIRTNPEAKVKLANKKQMTDIGKNGKKSIVIVLRFVEKN